MLVYLRAVLPILLVLVPKGSHAMKTTFVREGNDVNVQFSDIPRMTDILQLSFSPEPQDEDDLRDVARNPYQQIDPSSWDKHSSSILLKNVNIDQQGFYQVTANIHGRTVRGVAFLQVFVEPTMNIKKSYHGNILTLRCDVNRIKPRAFNIFWMVDGRRINGLPNVQNNDDHTYDEAIRHKIRLSRDNLGKLISCLVETQAGQTESDFVYVESYDRNPRTEPKKEPSDKRIPVDGREALEIQSAEAGSDVKLVFDGVPSRSATSVKLSFSPELRDDEKHRKDGESRSYRDLPSATWDAYSSSFSLKNVDVEQQGFYQVTVLGHDWDWKDFIFLQVFVKPSMDIKKTFDKNILELRCNVNRIKPRAFNIYWMVDGRRINGLPNVQDNNDHTYNEAIRLKIRLTAANFNKQVNCVVEPQSGGTVRKSVYVDRKPTAYVNVEIQDPDKPDIWVPDQVGAFYGAPADSPRAAQSTGGGSSCKYHPVTLLMSALVVVAIGQAGAS